MLTPTPNTTPITPPFGTLAPTPRQAAIIATFHSTLLGRTRFRRRAIARFKAERPGPVDAHLFGLKIRFHPHDNQTDVKSAVCGESYNRDELRWLRTLLAPGQVFVDIGANMGFFSLAAAKLGAHILAMEPHPAMFARLQVNFALNGLPARLVNAAAGDTPGTLRLGLSQQDLGSSSLLHRSEGVDVAVTPLHTVLVAAGITNIDLLKIDVEGYEDRALCPLLRTAPPTLLPRAIILEHASQTDWATDLFAALDAAGYTRKHATRSNTLLIKA